MKPKVSTGYLTPQAKKTKPFQTTSTTTKRSARNKSSDRNEGGKTGLDEDLLQDLLKCPEKKKMVLQLLSANKEAIKEYSMKNAKKSTASPINKLKTKKKACESPTALFRRRALEQLNSSPSPSSSSRSDSSRPSSRSSESSNVPFDKILDGVTAYVEIKGRLDADRSGGAKAVLKSMGATVRETFTNDVSHVVFKDGLFTTFQKAKLRKIHLVSILWVEFCRKTKQRQDEKQYPAMRSGFEDETMVCSQMQKEYEDIIREEYRRSIDQGTPLPTTQSFINRRRTLMTPTVSRTTLTSSSSSFKTAADSVSSQELLDSEVASINARQDNVIDDSLIMKDPHCFSDVSGLIVNGRVVGKENFVSQSFVNTTECSDMELTHIPTKTPVERIPSSSKSNIIKETPRRRLSTLTDRRKTICNSLLSSDASTLSLISSDKSSNNVSLRSSDKSTNVSDDNPFVAPNIAPKATSKRSRRLTKGSSSSLLEAESFIFGRNSVKPKDVLTAELDKTASAMSELKLSAKYDSTKSTSKVDSKTSAQTSTSMSSLQISSESKKGNSKSLNAAKSRPKCSSVMSSLRVSSDALKTSHQTSSAASVVLHSSMDLILETSSEMLPLNGNQNAATTTNRSHRISTFISQKTKGVQKEDGFISSEKNSDSEPIEPDVVESIIDALQTPEFVTTRKRAGLRSGSTSDTSEDSEILSLPRHLQKTGQEPKLSNNGDKPTSDSENVENISSEKAILDSNKEPNVLTEDPVTSPSRRLVVNIVRSPLSNLDNLGNNDNKTRRKTLGSRVTKKQETPSSVTRRRKTMAPQARTDSDIDTFSSSDPVRDSSDTLANENNKNRRKTLGPNVTRKQETPSSVTTRRKTMAPQARADSDIDTFSSSDTASSDPVTDNSSNKGLSKTKRKVRKLYNPDESIHIEVDDERERVENRNQIRKRKSDERVFINPTELVKPSSQNEVSSDSDGSNVELASPKRTRKAKNKNDEATEWNSSADEQKDLLNEVLNKKHKMLTRTPRVTATSESKTAATPSRRKSTRITKPPAYLSQNSASAVIPVTPRNRRSTLEFMSHSQLTASKKKSTKKADKTKLPTIVCTKLHKPDVQVFAQIVKKLGKFIVEDEVSDRTTHVVAGESKRTINMLRAISRGCWILKFEWVLTSLEEGKWVPEEDFEVTDFSPVIQKSRLERQAFGAKYTLDVFACCPPIYVASSTNPRCSDLKELITTCKGKVVTAPRMAKIVVGQYIKQENTVCVNETWVLDCITFYKKMSFKEKYLIGRRRASVVV